MAKKLTKREEEIEKIDSLIMAMLGAYSRRVVNNWIIPSKSHSYYQDLRRVFFKDGSPEGLYPSCVVTQDLLGEIVVIIPLDKFTELLKLWKKAHPKWVRNARKIVVKGDENHGK